MKDAKLKKTVYLYISLLVLGFLGLCLPGLMHLSKCNGLCAAIWILSFLILTQCFSSVRHMLINAIVFVVGYLHKYIGALSFEWIYAVLFLVMGLLQFGVFFLYSRLMSKYCRFIITLAFPVVWMILYILAMLVRFPSLIRVDLMFADMNVLLQAESLIGSFGLSFVLLWTFAIFAYAICNRKSLPAILGALLYFALLTIGVVYLSPNVNDSEFVRVAFSTGPYVGDYLEYTSFPVDRYLSSMQSCVEEASGQGAEIIVFNEETYEIDDTDEEAFLLECSQTAQEKRIHMLVGLDLRDTDGSEGGKSLNKVLWIDRNGDITGSYLKTKTIPMMETDYVRGNGEIPSNIISVSDRQIKVSYLICYDSNFPMFVNNIDNDTDILFLPSWDWPAVTEQHSMLCRTIAVENRVSIVKPTYDGINIAVRPDGTVIDSFDINEVGYEQIRTVDIPIQVTDRGSPEKDSYVYSIIGVEIMSILICIVLLYGNLFENHEKTPRNRLFSSSVIACIIALSADTISWVFDGCVRLEPVLYVSTVVSLVMTFVIDGIFIFYITEYIRERRPVSYVIPRLFMVLTIILIILTAAAAAAGVLFSFKNGVYREGPMYSAYVVTNLVCSVICFLSNLINLKALTVHDRIATMSYILLPWIEGCINLFVETFSYAYPAIVLSMVVVYVMIQSERQVKLEKEGSVSYYHARHDVLTGLFNRLAYEEREQELSSFDGRTGVVFTDVNGLKHTNDNFGHEAGDRLLIRYAELICRCFRKEEIFRISGDEFTVLLTNVDEETFFTRVEEFRRELNTDSIPMASTGQAYGNSKDVCELVKMAETDMYSEKEEFHRNHPEMGRR